MFRRDRLTYLRDERELHQKELADILGVKPQTISYYERGETQPSLAVIEKMALYFNVSIDYLMGLCDVPIPYSKENFIALPNNYPQGFKTDLLSQYELLLLKYKIENK